MLKLSIMTEEELTHIFGDLDAYIPLHQGNSLVNKSEIEILVFIYFFQASLYIYCFADLMMKLTKGTGPDGTVAQIGQIVIDWVSTTTSDYFHKLNTISEHFLTFEYVCS